MDKNEIRTNALRQRAGLTENQIDEKSEEIAGRLINLDRYKEADSALFYYAHNNEVDTRRLMEDWIISKKLYLPKLERTFGFKAIHCNDIGTLVPNKYGIPEPIGNKEVGRLDIILIPGVAFDESGGRIGMGKGYYDRFLSRQNGVFKIALAYESQILASLPKEPYDEAVDMIVTEKRVIRCK